ncbi:adenine phosphoribosyl transferase (predicted), isoform CRA_c [Rattus norvegicus]|uniref:Adenine phosphoribosyl transferase (Predicted), isoform CRA_c n=1 Tax=Rattus norvegicus TaxID=10116 RepID=A6IZS9_RAT|nr:adenine phosphoribosyl transferase (predicted), isoform CRA_c [Rattus norvegicus]
MRPCPNLSCSWWRGASAASRTSPSRACCSGAVRSPRGVDAVLSAPGAGAWAVSGILRGLCPATRGSLSCPCSQGYLAPLERSGLLPSFHPPPGRSPEVHARRQDRLHRRSGLQGLPVWPFPCSGAGGGLCAHP